jgi:Tol biopolymer transport system component
MNRNGLRGAAGALIVLLSSTAGFAGTLELVTGADPGALSDTPNGGASHLASLSADGRYVAFTSEAVDVVPDQQDTNAGADVFLRDRVAGTTVLVSHADGSPSTAGNASSYGLQISADGRYLLFLSNATNLVAGQIDSPNTFDLFLYDRVNGAVTLVSRSRASSHQAGNGASLNGALSADGRWVVFASAASDLVNGQNDSNGQTDVFLYDRSAGSTILLSRSAGATNRTGNEGSELPGFPASLAINRDGSQILFLSFASDLLAGQTGGVHLEKLYLYHRLNGTLSLVSHTDGSATEATGAWHEAAISADGNFVAFSRDGQLMYLYQRTSGTITQVTRTEHISHSEMPNLNADGRYLAFISDASDLAPGQSGQDFRTNVFLYDRVAGTFTLLSRSLTSAEQPASARSRVLSISADGRFVAYGSECVDLVPGQVDTADRTEDLFLFDRSAGASRLITHAADSSVRATGGLDAPVALSSDGRALAFADYDPSLVAGPRDLNRAYDVLLYDTGTGGVEIVSRREGPPSLTGSFSRPRAISSNGRYVLITSDAPNLVPGQRDANDDHTTFLGDRYDVFLYDRVTKAKTLVSHAAGSPVTTGNGGSQALAMTPDGRWTLFISAATDLVPGQSDDNGGSDLFLFDRTNGAITLVSHRAGSPATTGHGIGFAGNVAKVSTDGRFVAFVSSADDLVAGQAASSGDGVASVFLFDRLSGEIQLVTHEAGSPTTPTGSLVEVGDLTPDGRFLTFSSDSTHLVPGQTGSGIPSLNVFLYDRLAGSSVLVSHAPATPTHVGGGGTAQSRISADGLFVAFEGEMTEDGPFGGPFRAIYLFDRLADRVTFITFGERVEAISADGRIVAFSSSSTQVIPGQVDHGTTTDVFLYDRTSGAITLVSHAAGKPTTAANQPSGLSGLSADGNTVAFWTSATDVVPGYVAPQPRRYNVYLFNRATGTSQLISGMLGSPVRPANGDSFSTYTTVLSADGRSLAFESQATDLVPGIFYSDRDVYLYRAGGAPSGPVTLPPCTLFSNSLRSNARKTLTVAGACGVPSGAKQVMVKLSVSQGTGKGNVQIYPGNVTNPSAGILRFNRGASRSAGFTVSLGNGGIALLPFVNGNGTVRVGVEVDGYTP